MTYVTREELSLAIEQRDLNGLLKAILHGKNSSILKQAVKSYVRIGGDAAMDNLRQIVLGGSNDELQYLQYKILYALGNVNNPRIADMFLELLLDETRSIEFRERIVELIGCISRQEVASALGEALVKVAGTVEGYTKRLVFIALGKLRPEGAFELLLHHLRTGDKEERVAALDGLYYLADSRALAPALRAKAAGDPEISEVADDIIVCYFEGSFCEETEDVNYLLEMLEDDDMDIRLSAALSLGWFGVSKAVDTLLRYVKDPFWQVRQFCVMHLGEYREERVIEALIEALGDQDERVAREAIHALGKTSDEKAVKPLMDILKHSTNVDKRADAALALGKIAKTEIYEELLEFSAEYRKTLSEEEISDDVLVLCLGEALSFMRMKFRQRGKRQN